jgi:hypothetical protein
MWCSCAHSLIFLVSAKMVIPRWSCDDGSKKSDDNVSGRGTDGQEESGTALTCGGGRVGLRWVDKRNRLLYLKPH